jgi:hypothetical protein
MRVGGITNTSRKEWLGHSQETLNFRDPRKDTRPACRGLRNRTEQSTCDYEAPQKAHASVPAY